MMKRQIDLKMKLKISEFIDLKMFFKFDDGILLKPKKQRKNNPRRGHVIRSEKTLFLFEKSDTLLPGKDQTNYPYIYSYSYDN